MTSTQSSPLIRTFFALRFATGAAAWLAPNKTGRLIGLNAGVASESGCKSTGRFAASWVSIRAGELK